ncbi:hypothetical protein [Streptomyces collinus]|uniref:hypothetical protein n=1 Tax=Streptomyces collinus TaxID=42684 RepID=UPI0037996CD1
MTRPTAALLTGLRQIGAHYLGAGVDVGVVAYEGGDAGGHGGGAQIESGEQLLTAYWALSGYGLRASRALTWLGAAMLFTIVLLMAFGLAQDSPKQTATGTVPAGEGKVTFEIDKDDPQNPTGNRFTGERFGKALNITLNSVVFRSSGQELTTAGTSIEMTSRLTEPVLLGLAILAVGNRIKR